MKNNTKERCPHCGANMKKYRHVLNRGLVLSLIKLGQAGGKAKTSSLDLKYTERNNFQKLQYFGLIVKGEAAHVWILTDKGSEFLRSGQPIDTIVWTFRNELADTPPGERVPMKAIDGFENLPAKWRESIDYQEDSQSSLQGRLY